MTRRVLSDNVSSLYHQNNVTNALLDRFTADMTIHTEREKIIHCNGIVRTS